MNPYFTPDPVFTVDPADLDDFNAGTQRAIVANRGRATRERELDRLDANRRIRDGLVPR